LKLVLSRHDLIIVDLIAHIQTLFDLINAIAFFNFASQFCFGFQIISHNATSFSVFQLNIPSRIVELSNLNTLNRLDFAVIGILFDVLNFLFSKIFLREPENLIATIASGTLKLGKSPADGQRIHAGTVGARYPTKH
jgi:hypothetical protein